MGEKFSSPSAWAMKPAYKSTEGALAALFGLLATAQEILPYIVDHAPGGSDLSKLATKGLAAITTVLLNMGRTGLKKAALGDKK